MTTLCLPFEPPPAPPAPRLWRLVRQTSKAVYELLKHRLAAHDRAVYLGIAAYYNRYQQWPTSSELLEFLLELKARHPRHPRYQLIVDANSVRPRLTGMNKRGVIRCWHPRLCTSRRSRTKRGLPRELHTWRIPQVGDPTIGVTS